MTLFYATALFLSTISASPFEFTYETPKPCPFLYGHWEVYKAIDVHEADLLPEYASLQSYQEPLRAADSLANYMIGKQIEFTPNYTIINGTTYKDPLYLHTKREPAIYLEKYHRIVDQRNLGIAEDVKVIDVVRACLYEDEEQKKKKDFFDVETKYLPIPFPQSNYNFFIDKLIFYNDLIIIAFLVSKPNEWSYQNAWEKYLCLRRVQPDKSKITADPLPIPAYDLPKLCPFLYGQWEIYKTIDVDAATISLPINTNTQSYKSTVQAVDSFASYMVGKQIEFNQDYVIVNGKRYEDPIYIPIRIDADTYFYTRHCIKDKLSLGVSKDTKMIDAVRVYCYDVEKKYLPIPFPESEDEFSIDKLIIYQDEIILSFYIGTPSYDSYEQKYLCLHRARQQSSPSLPMQ